jgi:uncharacterized protein (DUF1800 family)
MNRRDFLRLSGVTALGLAAASQMRWSGARVARASELISNEKMHVLNRLTWGPTQPDIERINALGIQGYIDWQLNPDGIDDPRIAAFEAADPLTVAGWDTLSPAASDDYGRVYTMATWNRYYRATYSEKQFYELMVEFWTDHFNIPISDLLVEKVIDDRTVARTHALGKFRDLLFASAQSPAMLIYLDNTYSDKEHPNENYAREVMELHTLGVEGGYSEQDVRELARILTGWTENRGTFRFVPDRHDFGSKTFLGRSFPEGRGVEEGLQALDMLATHPATARFVCFKLCRRFIADMPPESIVDSAAQVWVASDGDIRQVMRHILLSPEFMASAGQRFKRPVHVLVSMLRVFGDAWTPQNLDWFMWSPEALGQTPYGWHPPNGYPDVTPAWITTGTLLERWNLAFELPFASEDWYEGADLDLYGLVPPVATAGEMVDAIGKRLLGGHIPDPDRANLINFITDNNGDLPIDEGVRANSIHTVLGLVFASPYFHWY